MNEQSMIKFGELFSSANLNEQWYIKILDSINDGILVADQNLTVLYVNSEYTRITGVRPEQIIGYELAQVRPGAILPQIVRSGKSVSGVYRREGDTEYVVDMAPILVDGEVVGGISLVKDITEVKKLSEEVAKYARKTDQLKTMVDHMYKARYTFDDIAGGSAAIATTLSIARRAARGDADILISGESGTGKEVFAQAIHNASQRRTGPFVAINCAAIAPTLVESELFGYEEGAFTGAKRGGRIGLFEVAGGGTLFLDEIAELSLEMQAKMLRALQERVVRRIGEAKEVPIDIRVIAATNKDLRTMVQAGAFRSDLYYRLSVLNISLPPLRERGEDIGLLAEIFFSANARKLGRSLKVEDEVTEVLLHYSWPGNVRELRNVIEHAVNMSEDGNISILHLPNWLLALAELPLRKVVPLAEQVRDFERKAIAVMLGKYGTSIEAKHRIASDLGISIATLYNKIKEKDA